MVRFFPGLSGLLTQLPLYIVWIVGIVIALVRWSRHPKVSLLLLIGLLVLLVQSLASGLLLPWLQIAMMDRGMGGSRIGMLIGVISVVTALIRTAAWGLILVAVFSGRESAA